MSRLLNGSFSIVCIVNPILHKLQVQFIIIQTCRRTVRSVPTLYVYTWLHPDPYNYRSKYSFIGSVTE